MDNSKMTKSIFSVLLTFLPNMSNFFCYIKVLKKLCNIISKGHSMEREFQQCHLRTMPTDLWILFQIKCSLNNYKGKEVNFLNFNKRSETLCFI